MRFLPVCCQFFPLRRWQAAGRRIRQPLLLQPYFSHSRIAASYSCNPVLGVPSVCIR
jgi:hypothetical protein